MDEVGGSPIIFIVVCRKVLIHTSMNFANIAMEVLKREYIFHISKEEEENKSKLLDLVTFNNVKRLLGISEVHSKKSDRTKQGGGLQLQGLFRYKVT